MCDTSGGECCHHDHVGDGELWLTLDELTDLIADGVDAMFALPGDATRAERRSAMRGRLDERRAEQAAPPPRAAQWPWTGARRR